MCVCVYVNIYIYIYIRKKEKTNDKAHNVAGHSESEQNQECSVCLINAGIRFYVHVRILTVVFNRIATGLHVGVPNKEGEKKM